jgi:hypothetical protein
MKLREHPGISSWPTNWLAMSGSKEKKLPGEAGNLTNLRLSQIEPISKIYLTVEYEGESYMGTLLCKDAAVARNVHDFLQKQIGRPFKEIADMEIPSP